MISRMEFIKIIALLPILKSISVESKPAGSVEREISEFKEFCIDVQNTFRLLFGAPPIKWDPRLYERAQSWANHLSDTQTLHGEPASVYGDNVFSTANITDIDSICLDAFLDWLKETLFIDFKNIGYNKSLSNADGRGTQMIWKETKRVGIGESGQADGKYFAVASYFPPGNILGRFKGNVLPLRAVNLNCVRKVITRDSHYQVLERVLNNSGVIKGQLYFNSTKPCALPWTFNTTAETTTNTKGKTSETEGSKSGSTATTTDTKGGTPGMKGGTSGSTGTSTDTHGGTSGDTSESKGTTTNAQGGKKQGTLATKGTQGAAVTTNESVPSSAKTPTKIMLIPVPEPATQPAQTVPPAKPLPSSQAGSRATPMLCVIPALCAPGKLPAQPATVLGKPAQPAKPAEIPVQPATPVAQSATPAIQPIPAQSARSLKPGLATQPVLCIVPAQCSPPGGLPASPAQPAARSTTPTSKNMNPPRATNAE